MAARRGPAPFLTQLLAHVEDAALVADANVVTQTIAAAKDTRVFQMHVRTVSTLVGLNVLPSHFPDFVTFGFRKRFAALFTSHGDWRLTAPLAI